MVSTRRYMGIAIVSGLVASVLFFMFLQRLNARAAAAIAERTDAVYVTRQAEPGQVLREDMLTVRKIHPNDLPEAAVVELDEVVGKTASVRLFPGEILLRDRLGAVSRLSAAGSVPPSRVAFALMIKPHTAVAALIAPGDRIDIITRDPHDCFDDEASDGTGEGCSGQQNKMKVLLADVRVVGEAGRPPLAEPLPPEVTPTPVEPNTPRTLILDLEPEQAVRLAEALDQFNIYVALRSTQGSSRE